MAVPRCQHCHASTWTTSGICASCNEFPTLGYAVAALIHDTCVIPDGLRVGEQYVLTDEMYRMVLWHYRIHPHTGRFVFDRGSQITRSQKWGKGPYAAAVTCAEAHPEGPVLFDGWGADGQPIGRPWPTPHIQITAASEDQAANVWRALVPMIELGNLRAEIPDTGKTRINLPNGGLIEPVTASAVSRLGQRVTFAVQDQTESWFKQNGGHDLAYNQRRGLAGMGGRFLSTPNAWDPTQDSVAQRLAESSAAGVYHDLAEPGPGSVSNKQDRRRMLRKVYGDSVAGKRSEHTGALGWVDLDRIDSEVVALLAEGEGAQAERWFLNRREAAESVAFDFEQWKTLARPDEEIPEGALVTLGVDGARFRDALAIVATDVETKRQEVVGIWERPQHAPHDYEHPVDEVDSAMVDAFERWDVWRAYVDPQFIEDLVDRWQGRWGDKRVIRWHTNRHRPVAWLVRNYTVAINAGDLTHDGDADMAAHVRNARKQKLNVFDEDDEGRRVQMHTLCKDRHDSPRKIDAAMAGGLSWEACGDAIADGALDGKEPLVAWG